MSSTIGHSTLAAAVAIPTNEATLPVKVVAIVCLVLSHGPLDAIPHLHYYLYDDLKVHFTKNALGAAIELGGGFIILPYLVWYFTGVNPWWLGICVFAASLFDFAVATGNKFFYKLNLWFHWWDPELKKANLAEKIVGEIVTLGGIMLFYLHYLGKI